MKRILAYLAGLGALALPASAGALPAGVPYRVLVEGTDTGTLVFSLSQLVAGGACRYAGAWEDRGGFAEDLCYFDEATWLGHFSCVENALAPLTSLVVVAPGATCFGFDTNGQDNPVFLLVAGEHQADGSLDGVVQFSAADQAVLPFHAAPGP